MKPPGTLPLSFTDCFVCANQHPDPVSQNLKKCVIFQPYMHFFLHFAGRQNIFLNFLDLAVTYGKG